MTYLIRYSPTHFPAHYGRLLRGRRWLTVEMTELVWAAISMGKPGMAHLFAHGLYSVSDCIVRAHTVYANLKFGKYTIAQSKLYEGLDPSEKGGVSYFFGMLATKVLCSRLLDAPWLFHLSMLKSLGGTAVLIDRSQPDLIGLNSRGGWVVAEAKGRSNQFDADALRKAKTQTRQLRKVNGQFPSLRVAVQACFSPSLDFHIADPEEYDDDAEDLDFDVVAAIQDYYSFIIQAPQERLGRGQLNGQDYVFMNMPESGVTIGISRRMHKALQEMSDVPESVSKLAALIAEERTAQPSHVQADGLVVTLDNRWSKKQMMLEPLSRRAR
ncbi:hypothetical protein POF53_08255 [Mitsuaria sp. RG]|nr:hypothetical protein [Mitsuaria sp. RG]